LLYSNSRREALTRRLLFVTPRPGRSMRILFDHGTPAPLIPFLAGHIVTKAIDAGWDRLVNGELLKATKLRLKAQDHGPVITKALNLTADEIETLPS
jgi:hypothetical protein